MVIAIALSALVAAMAYQSFDGASRNAARTREVLTGLNKLDKAWQLIGQDMRNIVPVSAQIPNPQVRFEAASQKTKGKQTFQILMLFSRRGWMNPLGRMRSDLQQVNYRVAEGKLWRDYLPERNVPLENIDFERESFHQLLLGDDVDPDSPADSIVVSDIQLRFLSDVRIKANGKSVLEGSDYSKSWDPMWPPVGVTGGAPMPVAVEITIELEGVGRSVRLFEIPQR
ncbi:MAG: type II secretion system protein GspJ [Gammaproteobacteria bacterium]|nr:MAG: type II secretion system protein GspJ [Gammaproteobacteria bacterium]